jgi:hypothetical protein
MEAVRFSETLEFTSSTIWYYNSKGIPTTQFTITEVVFMMCEPCKMQLLRHK